MTSLARNAVMSPLSPSRRPHEDVVTVGTKRKAPDADPEALQRENSLLQNQNEELRRKLRRLIAQGILPSSNNNIAPTIRSTAANTAHSTTTNTVDIENPASSSNSQPVHGCEDSETISQSDSAEITAAAPMGLAHLLMFLSIVLRIYGKMPTLVMDQMMSLTNEEANEVVAISAQRVSDDVTSAGHQAVISSWRRLLARHRLGEEDLMTIRRRLRVSTRETEMRLPSLSHPSSAAA